MIREITALSDDVDLIVLDVRRVDEVSQVALDMLRAAVDELAGTGRELAVIDPEDRITSALDHEHVPSFGTLATAVAYCEDQLLSRHAPELPAPVAVPVVDSPALATLTRSERDALAARMVPRHYDDGEIVRRVGQRFGGIYFIVSGRINTSARDASGNRVTLSTLSAGMTFGELALGSEDRQETTEKAAGQLELMVLSNEAIDTLEREDPPLATALWRALTRDAYMRVDQYLREVAARIRD